MSGYNNGIKWDFPSIASLLHSRNMVDINRFWSV